MIKRLPVVAVLMVLGACSLVQTPSADAPLTYSTGDVDFIVKAVNNICVENIHDLIAMTDETKAIGGGKAMRDQSRMGDVFVSTKTYPIERDGKTFAVVSFYGIA
jgi:hypothetical protein|tara:strand:- start:183 stop:497 length:315 start_codon:yes stop_codon:yes gene_type:complete